VTDDKVFVLDANVFIEAKRHYYAFDLAPKFWESLIDLAGCDQIVSIDRVKEELVRGKDELSDWAKGDFSHGFASTSDDDIIEKYRDIMTWVYDQVQFQDAAKTGFAAGADGWLVAYAMVNGCVVVTHEEMRPNVRKSGADSERL
jgi:hypothetical protein